MDQPATQPITLPVSHCHHLPSFWDNTRYSDLEVTIGQQQLHLHKLILSVSPYFVGYFTQPGLAVEEANKLTLEVAPEQVGIMVNILRTMYGISTVVREEELLDYLAMADFLLLDKFIAQTLQDNPPSDLLLRQATTNPASSSLGLQVLENIKYFHPGSFLRRAEREGWLKDITRDNAAYLLERLISNADYNYYRKLWNSYHPKEPIMPVSQLPNQSLQELIDLYGKLPPTFDVISLQRTYRRVAGEEDKLLDVSQLNEQGANWRFIRSTNRRLPHAPQLPIASTRLDNYIRALSAIFGVENFASYGLLSALEFMYQQLFRGAE
jgi:BTB/POZ domain